MGQQIFWGINKLDGIFKSLGARKVFLVCGKSFNNSAIKDYIDSLGVSFEMFHDFSPNPKYEDAEKGAALFHGGNYDTILAVGGGSSMDVAKYIKQNTPLPLITVPTTAGSGSESTKFLVIYQGGEKQSISSEKIIPEYVVLEPSVLKSLSLYQKKCTMLDALCQAIEAYWSVNSTEESKAYSAEAIKTITKNYSAYARQDEAVYREIMLASNKAGQAINIAKTTAAHAMSYKITSMLGLPHGHAVAICLPAVWRYLQNNLEQCSDPRGKEYLKKTLNSLWELIDPLFFDNILAELEIRPPQGVTEAQITQLVAAVNVARLGNLPIALSEKTLYELYKEILFGIK